MMRFEGGDLSDMRNYFDEEIHEEITSLKSQIAAIGRAFAERVRTIDVPIGPSHRKDVTIGNLRRSVTDSQDITPDGVEVDVSVGQGTDYVWYVAARRGVDFWRGEDDAEAAIDAAMNGD